MTFKKMINNADNHNKNWDMVVISMATDLGKGDDPNNYLAGMKDKIPSGNASLFAAFDRKTP